MEKLSAAGKETMNRYAKKRKSYLGILRRVQLPEFLGHLEQWLTNSENKPLRIAAPAKVSRRGEVILHLWGAPLTVWGWPLYHKLCGEEVLIVPLVEGENKMLVFATPDGRIWLRRFFDPEQRMFYAKGKRSFFHTRIYTLLLPALRMFRFMGSELLFPKFWKVGNLVHIWVDNGKIVQIAPYLSSPGQASLRRVHSRGVATTILVSGKFPRMLRGRISGTVDGVRIFETARGDLRFSATLSPGKNHSLPRADADRLGVAAGGEAKVVLEDGWPVRVIGPTGKTVPYLVVRDAEGTIIGTLRRRLCRNMLPEFAVIENLPIHYVQGKQPCVHAVSRRFMLPAGAGKRQRTAAAMLWKGEELLYVSGRNVLNRSERTLMRGLHALLSCTPWRTHAHYAAAVGLLRTARKDFDAGRLSLAGVSCLAGALYRIMRYAWEDSPSARRRDPAALIAGAFRLEHRSMRETVEKSNATATSRAG